MRRSKVKIGMFVVLNNQPDTQVYRVDARDNFTVTLSYPVSGQRAIGHGDCSHLREPTNEQMSNFLREQTA